jgi:hypothetical protein
MQGSVALHPLSMREQTSTRKNIFLMIMLGAQKNGAQEKTRTFMLLRALAPEASASTNSATWALPHAFGVQTEAGL